MRVAAKRRAEWVDRVAVHGRDAAAGPAGDGEWVEVVRVGSGDPIVLVPGLAGGWRLVAPLAQRLARRFEVIVCGLRGDRFPIGGGWAAEMGDHARDLAAVIDQLGLERPTVFGVSFGGAIALELAVEQPQRLGALIVQGAEARFRDLARLDDRPPGPGTVPPAERQPVRQPVLQPAPRRQARARPAGRVRGRAVLGDRPERHGPPARAARVVRRLRPALADRRPDARPGRLARRDRPAGPAAGARRGDPRAPGSRRSKGPVTSASSPTAREVARQVAA